MQAPVEVRILNLQTQVYRDVPIPRKTIVPSFVEFDTTGQRLFVISGPKATFDEFDLSDSNVSHLKSVALAGFAPIPRLTPLTFSNGSWAVSGDGRSIAGYRQDGALLVQDLADGTTTHAVPLEPATTVTPSQLPTSFSPDGESIYFGRPGGFFFGSPIARPWVGSPKQVFERLRTSIGMNFGSDESVKIAGLANDGTWTAPPSSNPSSLEVREFQTIQHVVGGQWELANKELGQWAQRRPEDWLPLPFRVLVLFELGKLDEADQMLDRFVEKAGKATVAEWLRRLAESSLWATAKTTSNGIEKQIWFHSHRLELVADNERTPSLFALAKAKELQFDFDGAIAAINEAVQRDPDSSDMHRFRIRLLERLGHSEAAIESHRALVRLLPWDRSANYHLTTALLHVSDTAAYHDAWRSFRSQFPGALKEEAGNEEVAIRARDQLAKSRLVLSGEDDETLRLALGFADANYQSEVAMKSSLAGWYVQCKGLAEFRRGEPENLKEAIRILDVEFPRFEKKRPTQFLAAVALTRFVTAMSHHKLDETDKATSAYLDGLDWHQRAEFFLRSSNETGANDWHAAELVRREAKTLLGIDLNQIEPAVTDTSNWQVLFEDNFDEGISDQWQQSTGEWEIVDGAAAGILRPQNTSELAFGRLERKLTNLPTTFEVEYETWTSDPMLSACLLRHIPATNLLDLLGSLSGSAKNSDPLGHRIALASLPNFELTKQGKPAGGVSLATVAPFGFWFNQTTPNHTVEPNRHYKVRIIRQPQRITVFVDGKQIMSERVRDLKTRAIRFFGRGEEGTTLFVDNVKVRVPVVVNSADEE
jgi:tetratricopeptide (TPR) repeat protein